MPDELSTFPVWVGPAKTIVFSQGMAYVLGVFSLKDGRAVLESSLHSFNVAKDEIFVEWPRLALGSGCWITWPDGKCAVFFGKPFPNAPSLTPSALASAVKGIDMISHLRGVPDSVAFGGVVLGDVLKTVMGFKTLRSARLISDRVKRLL
jgi:hypothetical protein